MRKSFDGLSGIITNDLRGNPTNGDVYIFINRRRDRMKLLLWEQTGFWLFYKRLEKGTFQIPPNPMQQESIELSYDVLLMLVEGMEPKSKPKRFITPGAKRVKNTHPTVAILCPLICHEKIL